ADQGAPTFAAKAEAVPIAAWTTAADDGEVTCTYTLEAFVDGRPYGDGGVIPAEVEGEHRRWALTVEGVGSGNHDLEVYRYRACDGGSRELLAVAGLGVVVP